MNWKTILIFVVIIIGLLFFFTSCINIDNYTPKPTRASWKIDYLKKIYPTTEDLSEELYDDLTIIFTNILPVEEQDKLKESVYKAALPGPSCGELPCPCEKVKKDGKDFVIPQVDFAPNRILQDQWPPCNIPGKDGEKCCASVKNYKECITNGIWEKLGIAWTLDTWEGNEKNKNQPPPKKGQHFKPTLWPDYTLSVSKYDPENWNSFTNPEETQTKYIEVLHSAFTSNNVMPGLWFYKVKGSGIFLEIDPATTLIANNKFDALRILYEKLYPEKLYLEKDPFRELANFILRKNEGDIILDNKNCSGWLKNKLDSQTKDLDEFKTGLDENMDYWLNGQFKQTLKENHKDLLGNPRKIAEFLKKVADSKDYDKNRFANTGNIDNLMIYLARKAGYTSIQLTVQPNVYTGWTIEVIALSAKPKDKMFSDLVDVKDRLSLRNPTNPEDNPVRCEREDSDDVWKYSKCLYCDQQIPEIKDQCSSSDKDVLKHC